MKALAEMIGVSYKVLVDWLDDATESYIPTRRLLALLPLLDDLSVLDHIEQLVGRVARALPEPSRGVPALAHVMREFAEFVETHCQAVEDGKWTPEEARECERQASDVMAMLSALILSAQKASQPHLRAINGK